MLHIAICDDESKICELYSDKLQTILRKDQIPAAISYYSDSKQFFQTLHHTWFDLIFLDIDMPGMTGLQIAEEMMNLSERPLLIFITNQDAMVYQSFQYHPFSFIRKSFFDEEIEQVLQSAIKEIIRKKDRFVFRCESEMISLAVSEILYFESCGNYLSIHTRSKEFRYRETMKKVEDELAVKGFLRIHKRLFGKSRGGIQNWK
jgi:DNA-binding LytR/AlgR family response regulator